MEGASTCRAARLPLRFEESALRGELLGVSRESNELSITPWQPHVNRADYIGRWEVAVLQSSDGSASKVVEHETDMARQSAFRATQLLNDCPHLRTAIEAFECETRSARLMRLAAGSRILEHCDPGPGANPGLGGEIRIHIPLITTADVEFVVAGRRIDMQIGECWGIDTTLPHRVVNRGPDDRVHLVIDCVINEWLGHQLAEATTPVPEPGTVERLRMAVNADPRVWNGLQEYEDPGMFAEALAAYGAAQGFDVVPDEIRASMRVLRSEATARLLS